MRKGLRTGFRGMTVILLTAALKLVAQENLSGRWTFDDPSHLLKAAVGYDLVLVGSHSMAKSPRQGDGAVNIGVGSYYGIQHRIAANGGGSKVNEFTLVMDIKVTQPGRWYTLFQTNPFNTDDGEWFIDPTGKMGVHVTGYTEPLIAAGHWYRLAVAVQNGLRYDYYIDGVPVLRGAPGEVDGRFSLEPTVLFFADENGEDNPLDVAEIMLFSRALSDAEMAALGGIPLPPSPWPIKPALSIFQSNADELLVTIDSTMHAEYGCAYPLTYKIALPPGSANLHACTRYSAWQAYSTLPEKQASDLFNGIDAVRFDYPNAIAYVSAAFAGDSDSLFLKIEHPTEARIPVAFAGICPYYDNREAVVTASADDWAESGDQTWYQSDEAFQITCRQFRRRRLWLSCGIITRDCTETTWNHIQAQLDSGYVEACSHSQTHSYGPYADPVAEIAGSKQNIIDHLTMPASFKQGEKEYVYTWIAPANYYDEIVNTLVGENRYLVNRRYNWPFDRFAQWNAEAGYYHTIGISREASPIWEGTTDLDNLNSHFDRVVAEHGIYHLMTHPYFLLQNGFDAAHYAWDHLAYISNKPNIWYVSVGHLYLYHFMQERAPALTSARKAAHKVMASFSLGLAYPNPFNTATHIPFTVHKRGRIRVSVYNVCGRQAATLLNEDKEEGSYAIEWNAANDASGVYVIKLEADDYGSLSKCLLIK